jgi:hypothetical protein
MSLLTIVLATYNRPASLRVAIRSVLLQTLQDWRLIVVGDACDDRTADVIEGFSDARISYVNLPARCGEQAIPNSIGMALADSEFIALLNHDDVLLGDHLEIAVSKLREGHADFFAGMAAFARFSVYLADGSLMPVFSELTPAERQLGDVFCAGAEAFEPCSAWVFRRSVFETVGLWRASGLLYRTPMDDWLLRVWRAGIGVVQGSDITVLRFLTHYQQEQGTPAYAWGHGEFEKVEKTLLCRTPDQIRAAVRNEITSNGIAAVPRLGFSRMMLKMLVQLSPEQEWLALRLLTPAMAEIYLRTGWDAFEQFCLLAGFGKGQAMDVISRIRTGEGLPPAPDFEALLAFARQQLQTAS